MSGKNKQSTYLTICSLYTQESKLLTVPLMETRIEPVTVPKRRPADMVNGTAGIARI